MKLTTPIKLLLAIVSGLCFGLGWPGTGDFSPLLFIAFVPLLFIRENAQKNDSKLFPYTFLAFFLWHMISVSWVYCVNEDFITKIISLLTLAVINPLLMTMVFQWIHAAMKRLNTNAKYLSFITIWIAFEYTHLHWSLSYPWMNLGNGLANDITWIQWYEYTGTFGGTLWILIVNLLLFFVIRNYIHTKKFSTPQVTLLSTIIITPLLISYFIWNNYEENQNPISVAIVQPNIDPYNEKFNGLSPEEQIIKLSKLGQSVINDSTDYMLGPETAIPLSINIDQFKILPPWFILKKFQEQYPRLNIVLGASLTQYYYPNDEIPATARKFRREDVWYNSYNSAVQIDGTEKLQHYHKSKLVHGVESMPFPEFFNYFQDIIFDLGGTTGSLGTQKEREIFSSVTSSAKVAPVICYESVYGEYCTEYIQKGANAIFILTNDGWWDDSPGYHQHFSYARLRAIETRRSIARSANTGTSGFFNQKGESFQETPWWQEAAISQQINLNDKLTFYTLNGDIIARVGTFIAVLLLLWTIVKKYSKEEIALK